MNKSTILKNVIVGLGGQLVIMILGIIVPRIMIIAYGSDINGLTSTITQIFTYMALLEAGISQAAKNALYKPIAQKDKDGISFIVSIAQRYFRKITLYYGIGVIALSFLAPVLLKTNVDRIIVMLIIILEGMSGVISFYYIETPSAILSAEGKNYINNGVSVINRALSYAVRIIMASLGINIVFLEVVYFLITIAKVFFYKIYMKKYYSWLNYNAALKTEKLKDRNAYVVTELAWTMFSSTDMIVLSIFVSTQMASVYSIYNMVFSNINVLLNAGYTGVNYILGQTYYEDIKKYTKVHDSFTSIFLGSMTVLMCVAYILILPFIKLYTNGITDVNYINESLPILFALVQMISWSRYISGNLTGIAGYAKSTSVISLIEALTNVVLSVIFVHYFGIVGVLLGTVLALPLKVVWCTFIADKKVMHRSCWKSISIIGVNYLFFIIVVLLSHFFQPSINSYGQFFIWGIILMAVLGILGMGLNFLINKDCWTVFKKYILKR